MVTWCSFLKPGVNHPTHPSNGLKFKLHFETHTSLINPIMAQHNPSILDIDSMAWENTTFWQQPLYSTGSHKGHCNQHLQTFISRKNLHLMAKLLINPLFHDLVHATVDSLNAV